MMTHTRLTRALFVAVGIAAVALGVEFALPARTQAADDTATLIARGEYLVGDAGQCRDCHAQNLGGGPAPKGPPGVPWAATAPSLVGLKMFATDADAIKFLSTTVLSDGTNALPPMPRYKFHVEDATAIVAYLRSLK